VNRIAACGLCRQIFVEGIPGRCGPLGTLAVHADCNVHNVTRRRIHWGDDRGNLVALIEWMNQHEKLETAVLLDVLRHPEAFDEQWAEFSAEEALKAAKR
jgi:hypothetical protein